LIHAGPAWTLDRAQVLPTPAQTPAATAVGRVRLAPPRAAAPRRARLDGVFPVRGTTLEPADRARAARVVAEHRPADAGPFDVVVSSRPATRPRAPRRARGGGRHVVAAGLRRTAPPSTT
jgi:hypothetical protein